MSTCECQITSVESCTNTEKENSHLHQTQHVRGFFQCTVKAQAVSLQHLFTSFDVTHAYIFNALLPAALHHAHTHAPEDPHTTLQVCALHTHTHTHTQVCINKNANPSSVRYVSEPAPLSLLEKRDVNTNS